MYERHEDYCDNEDCPCQQPPKEGECLQDRNPTERGNNFCSDLCAMRFAQERGIPYIDDEPEWERES